MMDEQRFVDEIFDNPDSDDAVLVYADWLEDHSQPDRARLLRAELEREKPGRSDPPRTTQLYEEERVLRERCLAALPVRPALKKKLTFSLRRALVSIKLMRDSDLTAADLRELARLPALKTLIDFDDLPARRLAELSLCPNIQHLKYGDNRPLTAADWEAIAGLNQVERLWLTGDSGEVGDEDVRQLSAMRQLKEVDLSGMKVSDPAVPHLVNLTRLEVLKLDGYHEGGSKRISDAGLAGLTALRRLKVLSLANTRITDAGLPHLLRFPKLTHLDLGATEITGDPLPVLTRLKKLRFLGLESLSGIDDTNVKELARRLPALRELDLRQTCVTRFRLARLLPKTKWRKIRLETSQDVYGTHEKAEVEAFEEFCREHDVLVDVEYE